MVYSGRMVKVNIIFSVELLLEALDVSELVSGDCTKNLQGVKMFKTAGFFGVGRSCKSVPLQSFDTW